VAPCLCAKPQFGKFGGWQWRHASAPHQTFFLENVIYTQTFEYRVNTVVKDNTVKFPIVTSLFIQLTSPQTLNPIHSSPSRQKQRPPPTKRCCISDGPPCSTPGGPASALHRRRWLLVGKRRPSPQPGVYQKVTCWLPPLDIEASTSDLGICTGFTNEKCGSSIQMQFLSSVFFGVPPGL
jgi:hypothetical protein